MTVLASHDAGDTQLVNAWGIAASATSPWWVANNGTGTSTIYNGAGVKAGLVVTVPGAPTGIVAYAGTQFLVAPGKPSRFLFASEDGTISGWNPTLVPNTQALVVFGQPGSGSIYKGLAIQGNTLYTTDFAECKVEAIDGTFNEFDTVGEFEDDEEIRIDGLWGIGFGNNAASGLRNVLYFAAGPDEETGGTFGKIQVIQ